MTSELIVPPVATTVADVVHEYYRRVDCCDASKVVAMFTRDAVYRRPGYPPLVGRTSLFRFYLSQRIISGGAHRIERLLVDATSAAVQGAFVGVLRDDTHVDIRFADFFVVNGDLIAERDTYFDAPLV